MAAWPDWKIICSFFQTAVMSILLYGCTTWTLSKLMEKKFDGNYTRILQAVLNKSRRQHPTKQQLYLSRKVFKFDEPDMRDCWRSKDKLISDVLLLTPSYQRAKVGRPARTYIQQHCADTGCSFEDLPGVIDNRDGHDKDDDSNLSFLWFFMYSFSFANDIVSIDLYLLFPMYFPNFLNEPRIHFEFTLRGRHGVMITLEKNGINEPSSNLWEGCWIFPLH